MTAAPSNALFAFPNYADPSPVYTPTYSGGNWQSGASLQNLQNRYLAYKTRSVGCTPDNTQFTINLGTKRSVQAVVLPKHNMSLAATYTITLYDSNLAQVAQLANMPVYGTFYAFGTQPFEAPSWYNGQLTPEQWYTSRVPLVILFSQAYLVQYVTIQLFDPNNIAGYIELSRCLVCPGYQPSINITWGANIGVNDPTVITPSLGGVDFFDVRPRRRTAVVSIPLLPYNEAFAEVIDMNMVQGVSGQLFFSFNPTDTINLFRHSFLATLTKLNPVTAAAYGYNSAAFELQEVIG